MARGICKVILLGNVGADPEVKTLPSGGMVANISIATSSSWKDKATGDMKEKTEWHRVVFFNRTAEVIGEYVRKGSQLYVEGRLQTRKWQDKDGNDRYTTEVVGSEMQMVGGRGSGSSSGDNNSSDNRAANHGQAQSSGGNGYSSNGNGYSSNDNDVNF